MSLCVNLKFLVDWGLQWDRGGWDSLQMDTDRWSVIEVLELFRKAALRASKWRDELALSGNSSIKSTTGH